MLNCFLLNSSKAHLKNKWAFYALVHPMKLKKKKRWHNIWMPPNIKNTNFLSMQWPSKNSLVKKIMFNLWPLTYFTLGHYQLKIFVRKLICKIALIPLLQINCMVVLEIELKLQLYNILRFNCVQFYSFFYTLQFLLAPRKAHLRNLVKYYSPLAWYDLN